MLHNDEPSETEGLHHDSDVFSIPAEAPLGSAVERALVRVLPLVRGGRREGVRKARRAPTKTRFDLWSELRLVSEGRVALPARTERVELVGERRVARELLRGVIEAFVESGTDASAHDAPGGVTLRARITDATAVVRALPGAQRLAAELGAGVELRMRGGWAVLRVGQPGVMGP